MIPSRPKMVAPDGSPVELYRRLTTSDAAAVVAAVVPPPATVLELGCGAGRDTRALRQVGYDVTPVDESAEMLATVPGGILSPIQALRLDRRFEVVLLASFLVHADEPLRDQLLAACAGHVATGGVVLIQRHDPEWMLDAAPAETERDGVHVRLHDIAHPGPDRLEATVTYTTDQGERWDHHFVAGVLDDGALGAALDRAGLHLEGWVDDRRRWAVARPELAP